MSELKRITGCKQCADLYGLDYMPPRDYYEYTLPVRLVPRRRWQSTGIVVCLAVIATCLVIAGLLVVFP